MHTVRPLPVPASRGHSNSSSSIRRANFVLAAPGRPLAAIRSPSRSVRLRRWIFAARRNRARDLILSPTAPAYPDATIPFCIWARHAGQEETRLLSPDRRSEPPSAPPDATRGSFRLGRQHFCRPITRSRTVLASRPRSKPKRKNRLRRRVSAETAAVTGRAITGRGHTRTTAPVAMEVAAPSRPQSHPCPSVACPTAPRAWPKPRRPRGRRAGHRGVGRHGARLSDGPAAVQDTSRLPHPRPDPFVGRRRKRSTRLEHRPATAPTSSPRPDSHAEFAHPYPSFRDAPRHLGPSAALRALSNRRSAGRRPLSKSNRGRAHSEIVNSSAPRAESRRAAGTASRRRPVREQLASTDARCCCQGRQTGARAHRIGPHAN